MKEDFPVSRCSLARLKGPTDHTQPFFLIYISGLISRLIIIKRLILLARDWLEMYLTLKDSVSLVNPLKLHMYVISVLCYLDLELFYLLLAHL